MVRIHHVNLGVEPGGWSDEAAFLVDVLGYRRLESPKEFPQAKWFEASDGSQVHLSEDPDHRPAARAHVAVTLGTDLDGVVERLGDRGTSVEIAPSDLAGRVAICLDPAGNRWELREH